jgi:hypothetical protein
MNYFYSVKYFKIVKISNLRDLLTRNNIIMDIYVKIGYGWYKTENVRIKKVKIKKDKYERIKEYNKVWWYLSIK